MNSSRKEKTALCVEGWPQRKADEGTGLSQAAQATETTITRAAFTGTTRAVANGQNEWDSEETTGAGGVCLLIA